MSWSSLASNQTVSFNNLQNAVNNGVFTAKTSIPASNEQITKADANIYVNIDTAYGPYAAKASNQLVVKSDLISSSPSFVTIDINNQNSLDIPITGMNINGVGVTFSTGQNFTINAGNNGVFTSTQLGTLTVDIFYGFHISGQNITFIDSNSTLTCQDLNGSAGVFTINNAVITAGTTIFVIGADGTCF